MCMACTQLDYELYCYARVLARRRTEAAMRGLALLRERRGGGAPGRRPATAEEREDARVASLMGDDSDDE